MRRWRKGIVITGFMGTGKTTVGRELAERLGMEFVDLDDVIEEITGMKIEEIFEREGEERFRDIESEALEKVTSVPGRVIATGGGAVIRERNRRLMTGYGVVVSLMATPGEIERRIGKCSSRPLLAGENVRERIEALLRYREKFYSEFDLKIDTDGKGIDAVVSEIIEKIGGESGT